MIMVMGILRILLVMIMVASWKAHLRRRQTVMMTMMMTLMMLMLAYDAGGESESSPQ